MRSVVRSLELGVLLLTSASIAFAQVAPATGGAEPPQAGVPSATAPAPRVPAGAAPAAASDPGALEEARELFWRAHSHFEKGEYLEALPLFERTYVLRPEPEVLFNLALTHQRLGHCDRARALYQEYQTRVQTDVTKQLGELDAQCSTVAEPSAKETAKLMPAPFSITVVQPPEPEKNPQPPPEASRVADAGDSGPFPYRTVGWVAVGAAAVALGTTVYFAAEGRRYRSDYEDKYAHRNDPNLPDDYADQLAGLEDDMTRAQTLAVVMGVASGVLAAGGVTLLVLAPSSATTAEPDSVQKLGLGLRWAGSF